MMTLDANGDGLLEGPQFHTLDTSWQGEIPWISSLHLAALAARHRIQESRASGRDRLITGALPVEISGLNGFQLIEPIGFVVAPPDEEAP